MNRVRLCEMAPRDGLQALNRERLIPVKQKVELIESIAKTGIDFIEVGSFVSPRAVPQMADTVEVCRRVNLPDGVETAGLVPNLKYYDEFKKAGLKTVALFVSASEKYSQFNMRRSIAEAMAWAKEVADAARRDGFGLRAHLSAVFHDIDGTPSDVGTVLELTLRLIEWGCDHVAWADTKGTAPPDRVAEVFGAADGKVDFQRLAAHFHDSFGMGVANAYVAYQCGVRTFDGSVGGIGGTPFRELAKGPGGGNVATEELACMFEKMGVATGVDLPGLVGVGDIVRRILDGTGDRPSLSKLLN